MTDSTWLAEQFERNRPHLRSVAYRMLGSVTESEDAVQEAWLRLSRTRAKIENPAAWLTTVIGRVCIDMLRARRSRREDYVGSWLPEPIVAVDTDPGPEESALIADSVGLALLVVLETLAPRERVAFVLHDMFAVPFEEIGPVIDASPAAALEPSAAPAPCSGPIVLSSLRSSFPAVTSTACRSSSLMTDERSWT